MKNESKLMYDELGVPLTLMQEILKLMIEAFPQEPLFASAESLVTRLNTMFKNAAEAGNNDEAARITNELVSEIGFAQKLSAAGRLLAAVHSKITGSEQLKTTLEKLTIPGSIDREHFYEHFQDRTGFVLASCCIGSVARSLSGLSHELREGASSEEQGPEKEAVLLKVTNLRIRLALKRIGVETSKKYEGR